MMATTESWRRRSWRPCEGPGIGLRGAVLAFALLASQPAVAAAEVTLTESSSRRIVFEYRLGSWRLEPVEIGEETFHRVVAAEASRLSRPGWPELPSPGVVLGIPFGVSPRLETEVLAEERVEGVRPLPAPTEDIARGSDGWLFPDPQRRADPRAYHQAGPYPARPARVSRVGNLRHQRVAEIALHPFRYFAASGHLAIATHLRVTVHLEGRSGEDGAPPGMRLLPAPPERPEWESAYQLALANGPESRAWRRRSVRLSRGEGVPERRLTPVNPLEFKLQILETGFHRIRFEDLPSFPAGVSVSSLKLFQREYVGGDPSAAVVEHRSPLRVIDQDSVGVFDAGDELVFHALSFGDQWVTEGTALQNADWEDAHTDTNVYWLSFEVGGGSPSMEEEGSWHDYASPTVPDSFRTVIRAEEDKIFFDFPVRREMDCWYWVKPGNTLPLNFPGVIPSLPVELEMRLIVQASVKPDDSLDSVDVFIFPPATDSLWIGGTRLLYNGRPADYTVTVDGSALLNGEETFGLRHTSSLQWYDTLLDWYRVHYTRRYRLESYENLLLFHNGGATGELEFRVAGFPAREIHLYRLPSAGAPVHLRPAPDKITLDPASGLYTLTYQDLVADSTAYVALDPAAYLAPAGIARLEGEVDLVNDPLAPDYLMIAHDGFVTGLDPLVDHRTSQGYRVRVAPVSRVYDLFGNGLRSPWAIKSYIRHAYENWNAGYALLVGDANRDERGLDNDNPTPWFQSSPNFLPTFYLEDQLGDEDYTLRAHDNWYADLSDAIEFYAGASGLLDWISEVSVGRFPVGSLDELAAVVEKTLTYETALAGDDWRRRVVFLADDEYVWRTFGYETKDCWGVNQRGFAYACSMMTDTVNNSAADRSVGICLPMRYWTDQHEPEHRYPDCTDCCVDKRSVQDFVREGLTEILLAELNQGALIWDYQGHANRNVFTHEYVYLEDTEFQPHQRSDSQRLTNRQRPFAFLGYACYISMFDFRTEEYSGDGIGEKMLLWPEGGAAALYASPGLELLDPNTQLNRILIDYLFSASEPAGGGAGLVLGPAVTAAAVTFDVNQSPARFRSYHIMGDPALRMEIGPPLMTVLINDSLAQDGESVARYVTMGELDWESEVRDENGIVRLDLTNTAVSPAPLVPDQDYTLEAVVDSGRAHPRWYRLSYLTQVTLGNYEIVLEAEDANGNLTSLGVNCELDVVFETLGDTLADGDRIPPRPEFAVRVSSPVPLRGADLGLWIDGVTPPGLDRAPCGGEGNPDSSSCWELALPEMDLGVGPHRIDVTLDTGTGPAAVVGVDFEIRTDVQIDYAFAYPNPFSEATTFVYHLSPRARSVEIDLYTVSGRKIRTLTGGPSEPGQNQLRWGGLDQTWDRVASGAYLFRLRAVSYAGVETTIRGQLVKIEGVD